MTNTTSSAGAALKWAKRCITAAACALTALFAAPGLLAAKPGPCVPLDHDGQGYVVCRFDATRDVISLHHRARDSTILASFDRLAAELETGGRRLVFAMNAGMYHSDRSPVGLLTIGKNQIAPLNRGTWVGNFYLKPNGVFYIEDGRAGVLETNAYRQSGVKPQYATQSGPMLVIDGKLHPRFLVDATSRNIRNGVGVSDDGREVIFAISSAPVTFHEFGRLFRDHLGTPNALYLDGSISRLYAPALSRNDAGEDMGPIVAVTAAHHPGNTSAGQE